MAKIKMDIRSAIEQLAAPQGWEVEKDFYHDDPTGTTHRGYNLIHNGQEVGQIDAGWTNDREEKLGVSVQTHQQAEDIKSYVEQLEKLTGVQAEIQYYSM